MPSSSIASPVRTLAFTIPANTAIGAPFIQLWDLGAVTLDELEIAYPDGSVYQAGFALRYLGSQLFPFGPPGEWYLANASSERYPVGFDVEGGVQLVGYNLDVNPHTIYLRAISTYIVGVGNPTALGSSGIAPVSLVGLSAVQGSDATIGVDLSGLGDVSAGPSPVDVSLPDTSGTPVPDLTDTQLSAPPADAGATLDVPTDLTVPDIGADNAIAPGLSIDLPSAGVPPAAVRQPAQPGRGTAKRTPGRTPPARQPAHPRPAAPAVPARRAAGPGRTAPPALTVSTSTRITQADWQLAQTIGRQYGVDPLLLVAIGVHETAWGAAGDGRPPPAGTGHILGVGSYDSGSTSQWQGLRAQLTIGAQTLVHWGVHTRADVAAGKLHVQPDGAVHWASADTAAAGYPWTAAVLNAYDSLHAHLPLSPAPSSAMSTPGDSAAHPPHPADPPGKCGRWDWGPNGWHWLNGPCPPHQPPPKISAPPPPHAGTPAPARPPATSPAPHPVAPPADTRTPAEKAHGPKPFPDAVWTSTGWMHKNVADARHLHYIA